MNDERPPTQPHKFIQIKLVVRDPSDDPAYLDAVKAAVERAVRLQQSGSGSKMPPITLIGSGLDDEGDQDEAFGFGAIPPDAVQEPELENQLTEGPNGLRRALEKTWKKNLADAQFNAEQCADELIDYGTEYYVSIVAARQTLLYALKGTVNDIDSGKITVPWFVHVVIRFIKRLAAGISENNQEVK